MSAAEIDDGGPAFPVKVGRDNLPLQVSNDQFIMPGMSLRDYFAASASESDIQRHLTGPIVESVIKDGGVCRVVRDPLHRTREEAKFAYADAMIKVRNP